MHEPLWDPSRGFDDECTCEAKSQTPSISPGPVADEEILARLIISPIHWNGGQLLPTAFSDTNTIGLSVNRIHRMLKSELEKVHNTKIEIDAAKSSGKVREYLGYVYAVCEEVRKIRHGGRRGFCVVDTADAANPFHADVIANQELIKDKNVKQALRGALFGCFTKDPELLEMALGHCRD